MKVSNLNDLFIHEVKDLYDAELQLTEALPKMAKAAANPELAEAFQNHLQETQGHVARLEAVFEACGEAPKRESCKGMKGLIAEGEKMIEEIDDPDTLDAALISAAQRVEHYEIAAYGTLKVWAQQAGLGEAVEHLEATLEEEKAADEKVTEIAEAGVNAEAEAGDQGDGETSQTRRTTAAKRGGQMRSRSARKARS